MYLKELTKTAYKSIAANSMLPNRVEEFINKIQRYNLIVLLNENDSFRNYTDTATRIVAHAKNKYAWNRHS
ncbi:hypothetical protein Q8G50_31040, partial [Klebsiella pneumoniae]